MIVALDTKATCQLSPDPQLPKPGQLRMVVALWASGSALIPSHCDFPLVLDQVAEVLLFGNEP